MVRLKKKDILYYARTIPKTRIYEVCEVIVRTVRDTWFVAVDKRDKRAYLFNNNDVDKIIFFDRNTALFKVNKAEESEPKEKYEIDYEEY